MLSGVALIEKLCLAFGPTGCEEPVAAIIREELAATRAEISTDRMGNVVAHLPGPAGAPRVMLSAHMDEVGFMITDIEEKGWLRFSCLGGIDPRVLAGRFVNVGDGQKTVPGIIAALGIHFQKREDRKKVPEVDDLFIDVGVDSKEAAEALVSIGDFAAFDTPFARFGHEDGWLKGKALDDRAGCAVLIEVLRALEKTTPCLDLYFCFTVREEIGLSGAVVTAHRLAPDFSIVVETTAIADVPGVPDARRVADVGQGGVLSLLDNGTIYDRAFVDFALATGQKNGIPVQVKRYVSGGNDAKHIQRSGAGVRCLALSAPTRYLHAPVSVAALSDIVAIKDLLFAMLTEEKKEGNPLCMQH